MLEGAPKLVLFVPCEKIIIGQDNTLSIITIFEALIVERGKEFPADAMLPAYCHVIAQWRRTPESVGKHFQQKVEMFRPDGVAVSGGVSEFSVTATHLHYRNMVDIYGLPIGLPGDALIKLSLREAGENNGWSAIAEYPLQITHKIKEAGDEKPTTENTEVE